MIESLPKLRKNFNKYKLILICGATASGKSFFAKKLTEFLNKKGFKTILISSDNFYHPNTNLLYQIYHSYDFPQLIKRNELEETISNLLNGKKAKLPLYDFKTSLRIGETTLSPQFDYLIVEGLYVCNFLKNTKSYKIKISSSYFELFTRRIIRDHFERNIEIPKILNSISTAFSLWEIFGEKQKYNYEIYNDYNILSDIHIYSKNKFNFSLLNIEKIEKFCEIKYNNKKIETSILYDSKNLPLGIKININNVLHFFSPLIQNLTDISFIKKFIENFTKRKRPKSSL